MNELSETFSLMKRSSQLKRAQNRQNAPDILKDRGIQFIAHTDAHLTVTGKKCLIDLWPGTGKFILRDKSKKTGRGIFNLIREYC